MLERKPRVGEKLDYDSRVVGGNKQAEYAVIGFGDRAGQESIIRLADTKTGAETSAIWMFKDGLNKCLSHKPGASHAEAATPAA